MKNNVGKIFYAIAILGCGVSISSCNAGDGEFFSIKSSSEYFYCDKNIPVELFVENDYFIKDKDFKIDYINFSIVNNECSGRIEKKGNGKWLFYASKVGTAIIEASYNTIKSSNTLTINSLYSKDSVANNLKAVLDTDGGVVLGQEYDLGINKNESSLYTISGADNILKINENGKLEVCGIGQGKIYANFNNEPFFNGRYTVYNSTLATKIKEDLISQGKISSKSDLVPNDLLNFITSLNMNGELINDPSASYGIKYLKNLNYLDLSSNGLKDASFISGLTNIETLILNDNNFDDISSIVENENLKKLDLSNNKLVKITNLQYLYKIEYLNLSNNFIDNISPLSSSYSLKSLILNNNKIQNFKDSLSGLENLKELGIGNCGIPFTDIISLKYLPNIESLDISGTKPTLKTLATILTKLKNLKISECNLDSSIGDDSLSYLNNLKMLESLDISYNNLDFEKWYELNDKPFIDGSNFPFLKELHLGGNNFTSIPDLSAFSSLDVLDLSESSSLTDVNSLTSLKISTLILDNCNSISDPSFAYTILSNENIKKLSTIGAFNYLDKNNFNILVSAVNEDKISWKFLDNTWVTSKSVNNYTKIIYFSMNDFLSNGTIPEPLKEDEHTIIQDGNREIILSLINDVGNLSNTHYTISIPRGIFRIQVYGNRHYSYDMSFNILDRKESSITLNFYNFKDYLSFNNGDAIKSQPGAKVIVNACSGENIFHGADGTVVRPSNDNWGRIVTSPTSGFNGYDLRVKALPKASISFVGGNGGKGPGCYEGGNGKAWGGDHGDNGANAITCHSCTLVSGDISIKGGNGGNGGDAHNFLTNWAAGNGGNGGDGISYSGTYRNNSSAYITGGSKGIGGTGGSSNDGINGQSTRKR